ncbi:hypothetical protein [Williamsia sp. CHRR-6]|uniref:hypothetical protein n=1 Tax=Williamsia sp. CHRR-6 TaxID=2835871 RepID=UPI001BD9DEB5|nr:hypothetical protein [Williamsia sp. CHRR-6]MBT0567610.1 hypothetical protein [Williamsia sp. CHRR-6]
MVPDDDHADPVIVTGTATAVAVATATAAATILEVLDQRKIGTRWALVSLTIGARNALLALELQQGPTLTTLTTVLTSAIR